MTRPVPALFILLFTLGSEAALVEREAFVMDTEVRLATRAASRADGLQRLDRALAALEQTEAELSTWIGESAMSALNRSPAGQTRIVDAATCTLLGELQHWQRETGGAFDPAIGALIAVWDIHGGGHVPTPAALAEAREASGFPRLHFDPVDCTVTRGAGVTIDVGAFGKGEGLDRAARVFGDEPWIIDLGGQVAAGAGASAPVVWPVAMAHPDDRHRALFDVAFDHGSLSTSGRSQRDREAGGVRIGHILDPRTGRPASFNGSVSVWHPRALVADILSTALFVMGPEEGLAWAGERGIAVCYLFASPAAEPRRVMNEAFRMAVLSSNRQ